MSRNTREDMRYSWKRFWLSTCSTRSWWITRWFKEFGDIIGHSENRRNWGKWERRTIAVNTFILFLGKSKTKSLDGGKRPLFMTRHGNSELSPLGNASVIPLPNKISEPNCEFPSRSLRKGSQHEEGDKTPTPSGRLECFQRKTSGFCSNEDNCNFLYTHATRRRETMWKEVKDARKSHPEQVSSSGPEVEERIDVKNSNSLKASPATRVKKIPCLWLTRWKRSSCNYRHHPVCRGYKSGKHVHLWHSLPFFGMLDEK